MSHFFIERPIFAWVIAIIIMLGGALAIKTLPIAQYPNIAMPEIAIWGSYPGASAKTVEESVTQVIEQQMKGIDNLSYMYSTSDSSGNTTINLVFEAGTDADIAQVQVQNKLQLATPMLPEEVQRQGIRVVKSAKNFLMVAGFVSADNSMSETDISDYVASNLMETIGRLNGVGDTMLMGAQYAMRIWCDPAKFEQYKLSPLDVAEAIRAQNSLVPGGQVGGAPSVEGQQINITIDAASRLETVEQFENIFLRINEDGSTLLLKDVARVELNGESFMAKSRNNGRPSTAIAIRLAPGANALETAQGIKGELAYLSNFFPPGLQVVYPYDSTIFVELSIKSVFSTLIEAVVLVFLVMLVFLQNFRATLIPTIAVPVVLLGTFGIMALCGFSINTLTMFGMVLAIGLLVDDAIVVVENVDRLIQTEGLSPKEAAKKSMTQITGALVGIALVLAAVFVPMAFMQGSTGIIYQQFSITIASAMGLSVLVAIVLTPALCATMLKPHQHNKKVWKGFQLFNRAMEGLSAWLQKTVGASVLRPLRYMGIFAAIVAVMIFMFAKLPTSFLPDEDQGTIFVVLQLPSGASFERNLEVLKEIDRYFLEEEKDAVEMVNTVAGFSFMGFGQNTGMAFVRLRDWSERNSAELRVPAIVERASKHFASVPEAMIYAFSPPALVELGTSNGFVLELLDRGQLGHEALMSARNQLLQKANARPELVRVRPNGQDDVEQLKLNIDMAKAGAYGVSRAEINAALSAYWGGMYVNDFTDKGRTKKVYLQADLAFRSQADDLQRYYVRNQHGEMVKLSSFVSTDYDYGSPRLERYNGVSSMEILGEAAAGYSTGQAMAVIEELAKDLPRGIDVTWTGLSLQEKAAGDQAPMLYTLSLLVVFLCLAALYESWSIPLSVLLVVPLGVLGALLGAFIFGFSNDIYFQVGILTIIGLGAKNAILIVEFARDLHAEGKGLIAAAIEATRLRLRPILMTSFAFILGVLPLALSNSAGAGAQNSLGTGVVCGMLIITTIGTFFIPIFFVFISRLFKKSVPTKEQNILVESEQHV